MLYSFIYKNTNIFTGMSSMNFTNIRYLLFCLFYVVIGMNSFAISNGKIYCQEHNFADTIKFTYKAGQIFVPISIGDKEYRFLFDTGAPMFMLNEVSSDFIKHELDSILVGDFTKSKKQEIKHGFMRDFALGKLHFSNYEYCIMNYGSANDCDGFWGVSSLFEYGLSMKIDLKDGVIILTDIKDFFDNEQGLEIPYDSYNSYLNMRFSMSYGRGGWVRFDTGVNSFMTLNKKDYYDKSIKGKHKEKFKEQIVWSDFGSIRRSVHGLENPAEHIFMKINEIGIGDVIFEGLPVEVTQGMTTIGSRILEYGSIIIDSHKNKMKYQPNIWGGRVSINDNNEDVMFVCESGNIYVAMLNPNSDIYKQGLRKGNYLIEYNQKPIKCIADFYNARNMTDKDKTYMAKFKNEIGDVVEIMFNR